MKIKISTFLFFLMSLSASKSYTECTEYTIIDHGDRVEAVCVGVELSDSEKKEKEKQFALEEEIGLRNALTECQKALPKQNRYSKNKLEYEQSSATCKELENELNKFLAANPRKPPARRIPDDDEYENANGMMRAEKLRMEGEMLRQENELRKQEMQIQRMQQQQKFDRIWR